MIISINEQKAFDKSQYLFMIKALNKIRMEGTYLNIIKDTYDKPVANITLRGEKNEATSSKVRKETFFPLLLNIVLY
jgi:hypothetical protein